MLACKVAHKVRDNLLTDELMKLGLQNSGYYAQLIHEQGSNNFVLFPFNSNVPK